MGKYAKLISIINTMVEINKMTDGIDIETVEHLASIAPDVKQNIDLLRSWLSGDIKYTATTNVITPTTTSDTTVQEIINQNGYTRFDPNAEWKPVIDLRLWCSSSGLIYSEEKDALLTPKYHNGDYMVTIDETDPDTGKKRAGVIMARAFRIQSDDRLNDQNVLEYRNGDRKDIRPENIYWRPFEQYNLQTRTIEDICKRIIEFNGNLDLIMNCYDENDRFASRPFVRSLLDKKQFSTITDKFFMRTASGKIIVRQIKSDKPMGADIGEFLRKTGDITIARQLLIDKVKTDINSITVDEEAMMVIIAVVEGKKLGNKDISKYVRDNFGYTIAYDSIENWKSAKDNQIYQIIEGGNK